MASKYYWCPVCRKQYISREYATRCHGIDPVTKRPEPEKPVREPISRPAKPAKTPLAIAVRMAVNTVRTPVLLGLPDENCKLCAIARKYGTVLRCQCMTKM